MTETEDAVLELGKMSQTLLELAKVAEYQEARIVKLEEAIIQREDLTSAIVHARRDGGTR